MIVTGGGNAARVCVAAFALSLVTLGAAQAQGKTYVMKISTPTINDVPDTFGRNFGAAVERDSGGRIKSELYPASQLGAVTRQIEGTQFGSIQCSVIPPEFFVGVDERFEVMAAPGLVDSFAQGQRLAADPAVRRLMLGLGVDKGLHGVGLFMAQPSSVISKNPILHLADFKGKKIRVFPSQFQSVAIQRLGATPKVMTLGDVLPALQDNAIDGAITGMTVLNSMHFQAAAKYVTETGQPAIFIIVEISKKWYDSLPADLQQIVDKDAAAQSLAINPFAIASDDRSRKAWISGGGELISLPPDEQSTMLKILASVGDEVAATKPALNAAYKIVTDAAQRAR